MAEKFQRAKTQTTAKARTAETSRAGDDVVCFGEE